MGTHTRVRGATLVYLSDLCLQQRTNKEGLDGTNGGPRTRIPGRKKKKARKKATAFFELSELPKKHKLYPFYIRMATGGTRPGKTYFFILGKNNWDTNKYRKHNKHTRTTDIPKRRLFPLLCLLGLGLRNSTHLHKLSVCQHNR